MNNFFEDNNEKTIIDELIESISNDIDEREEAVGRKEIIVEEYQIMMNCDQSDYIIYLKKC